MNINERNKIDLSSALDNLITKQYTSGDIVRMARERLGFKSSDLTTVTGINSGNITNYENGSKGIGKDVAKVLAVALKISPASILYPNGINLEDESLRIIKERSDELISRKQYA